MEKITYINSDGVRVQFSSAPPFILQGKEGFSSVDNTITSNKLFQQDGEQLIDASLAVRNLTISGTALGKDREDYLQLRKNLIKAFNPKLVGTLVYTQDIGEYQIDVIPENAPAFKESDGSVYDKPFEIMLKALDPYWIDKTEKNTEIPMARIEPMMEWPLEISAAYEFARLIAGDIIEVRNNGDVAVGAVFTIAVGGPLVNPRIYNVLTQDYFAFNSTFVAGSQLRISTVRGSKSVEQNDGAGWYNIMTKRNVASTFLQLETGVNYLQLQADSGVELTYSYIEFEPKIVGV